MKLDDKLAKFQAKQEVVAKRKQLLKQDNRIVLIASAVAVVLAAGSQLLYFGVGPGKQTATPEDEVNNSSETATPTPNSSLVPSPELAENRTWNGSMTVAGAPVQFELDGSVAPQAVANFVDLAKKGFFENLSCHRLTTAGIFVLQCGDPSGDGTGGPGYNWGPIENAPADSVYQEGVLAMARRGGDGASMGSQFFIVYQESMIPSDGAGGYTIFGKVTSGLDKIKEIAAAGTADGSSDGSPASEVTLASVAVE